MSQYYFSAETCGFYIKGVNEEETIPDDALEITEEVYEDIFQQQYNTGKKIVGDANGYPILDPSETTSDENKTRASTLLLITDWTTLSDVQDETNTPHLTNYLEFKEYRAQLRVIAANPPAGDIDWPTQPTAVWSS
jgi:hypothetical protein